MFRYHQLTGIPDPSSRKLATLFEIPLIADPGTRWEYGTSTDWLGLLVQAVSGQRLDVFCAERIFAPLAMVDATFTPTEEQVARMMTVHSRRPDGGLVPTPLSAPADPEFYSAGSGAYATALDYMRFLRALLRGGELDGERILQDETVELAFTDHLNGAPPPDVTRSAVPELTNDVPSWPIAQGWGLGFRLVLENIPAMRRAGTGDWVGLANCYFWIDRDSGIAGAFLTQVLPFFDTRIVETSLAFDQGAYALVSEPAAT